MIKLIKLFVQVLDAVQRVEPKAVVALEVVGARRTELLGSSKILIAPVVGEFRARLKSLLLRMHHIQLFWVCSVGELMR